MHRFPPQNPARRHGSQRVGLAFLRILLDCKTVADSSRTVAILIDKSRPDRSISAIEQTWRSGVGIYPESPHE
jgi:hypothetical protein